MIMDFHHPKPPPVPTFNQASDGVTHSKPPKSFGGGSQKDIAMPGGFTPGSTMMSATPTVIGGQENAMSFQYMKDIGISQMGTFEHYGVTPSHKGNPLQGVEPMIANHRPVNNTNSTMGKIAKAIGLDDKENESEIRDRALAWARGEGFTKDQLTEFDHLMGMISGNHINKNKLTGMREIDRGSFGKIFKSSHEGSTVAVKQLANQGPATLKAKMRELLLELRVLVRVDHPNIVKFFGTATDFNKSQQHTRQPYVGLVFEFCDRGSLHKAIFEEPHRRLNVSQKLHIAQQMGEGLTYLHSKRIIHRDLNTRNILLTNNLTAKIADFGCARVISGSSRVLKTTTISGSPAYMAPEQMTGEPLTEAVDVWALSVMLWEVLMDQKPWEGRYSDFQMLKHAIVHGEKLHLPISAHPYPHSYLNAIKMGMQTRAVNRPTMEALTAELKKAVSQYSKATAC